MERRKVVIFFFGVKSHGRKEGCYFLGGEVLWKEGKLLFFLWGEVPWKEGRLLFFGG